MTGLTFNEDATHGTTRSIYWKNPLESPPPKPPFLPARRAPTPFVGCRKPSYQIHISKFYGYNVHRITRLSSLSRKVRYSEFGIPSSANSLVHG